MLQQFSREISIYPKYKISTKFVCNMNNFKAMKEVRAK